MFMANINRAREGKRGVICNHINSERVITTGLEEGEGVQVWDGVR